MYILTTEEVKGQRGGQNLIFITVIKIYEVKYRGYFYENSDGVNNGSACFSY